jgi:nucleotide-binding universal stress UspA family protein
MSSPAASICVALQKILFPTDFSSSSEIALTYGLGLCRRYDATLHMVTVIQEEITNGVQPPAPSSLRKSAEDKMANPVNSELFKGIKHYELVTGGSVSQVLLELIDKLEIDLVVLGTHGRVGIKKLVLGSVAEEIVNCAPCAVLTVGPHICSKWVSDPKLRSILYATDLLPGSATALKYAVWLAEQEHARLTLLHVLKVPTDVPFGYPRSEKAMATKRLVQLLPPDTAPAVGREFIVEIGAPAEHIVRVAKDLDADLIVMGPHHTSHAQLSAHLPWVAPHQVLCQVQCPVLTVPNWMRPIAEKTPQDG